MGLTLVLVIMYAPMGVLGMMSALKQKWFPVVDATTTTQKMP